MAERELDEAARAAESETGCNIDIDIVREESSWYSIMNVLALSLGSGMGIPSDQSWIGNMGIDLSGLRMRNPSVLNAFFKNGDPHLNKNFSQTDLDTWRWSSDSFDTTLVPQAQGWSILAETECAKWLNAPLSSQEISQNMRTEWMSNSALLCAQAREQCDFAFNNLRNSNGLFAQAAEAGSVRITDSAANLEDQFCMLWACSDVAMLAGQSGSALADDTARGRFLGLADELFQNISENKDSLLDTSIDKVQAQSVAVPALSWYACATASQDLKARSLWLLREFADNLVKAQDASETVGNTIVDAAAALRALTEAYRITKLRTYAESATKIFNYIESQWWKVPGVYAQTPLSGEYTYNVDDIGVIVGALNASHMFLNDRIDRDIAVLRMRLFFCKTFNVAGLQMSMPSTDFLPEWLRQREPENHFRYDTMPLPAQAGGDFGLAPVFAGEISYDPHTDTWARNMWFDTQSAMHSCCELLWVNHGIINGFPEISFKEAPLAVRQAAGVEA